MNKLSLVLGLLWSAVAAEYTTTLLFVGLELDSQAIGGYVGSIMGTVCSLTLLFVSKIVPLGYSNTRSRMPRLQRTP